MTACVADKAAAWHEFLYIRGHVGPVLRFSERIVHLCYSLRFSHCWAVAMVKHRFSIAFETITCNASSVGAFLQSSLYLLTVTIPYFLNTSLRFWHSTSFASALISSLVAGTGPTLSPFFLEARLDFFIRPMIRYAEISLSTAAILSVLSDAFFSSLDIANVTLRYEVKFH